VRQINNHFICIKEPFVNNYMLPFSASSFQHFHRENPCWQLLYGHTSLRRTNYEFFTHSITDLLSRRWSLLFSFSIYRATWPWKHWRRNKHRLKLIAVNHPGMAVTIYALIYIAVTGLSLPGAGHSYFGRWRCFLVCCGERWLFLSLPLSAQLWLFWRPGFCFAMR